MSLAIGSINGSELPRIEASISAPPAKDCVCACCSDSFSPSSTSELEDTTLLAKRIVGQYGKTENVQVLSGTDGNDKIHISNGQNGGLQVSVNGEIHNFTAEQAAKLVIDGGSGDDTIMADTDVTTRLFLSGGRGNDTIISGSGNDFIIDSYGSNTIDGGAGNDSIISSGLDLPLGSPSGSILRGGEGNDYLEGGRGNDLIEGGSGNNVIYGLEGNDTLSAGSGRNYIDGGRGDDLIHDAGRSGMLFGGQGNDTIIADQRASVIVDSVGNNTITAPQGAVKTITASVPYELPQNFTISGSPAFQARVQSDFDNLQQMGLGQQMFSEIAKTGYSVNIKETSNNGNQCGSGKDGHLRSDKTPGPGISSTIQYNRAGMIISGRPDKWAERPPLVGLFHEFSHSYNAATGTMDYGAYRYDGTIAEDRIGLVGAEYQAVGIDHPHVKSNGDLSENGMRRFLGIEERTRY